MSRGKYTDSDIQREMQLINRLSINVIGGVIIEYKATFSSSIVWTWYPSVNASQVVKIDKVEELIEVNEKY